MKWMKNKEKRKQISFFYMIKKIYPMCFKAQPTYYIFIQLLNIVTGLTNGLDLLVTQLFFDSVVSVSMGKKTLTSAFVAFGLYIALKLIAIVFEGFRQYAIEVHSSRVMGYMMREIHRKSATIDPIAYETPQYLDDINKAASGTDAAIYFNLVTSFIITYHLPYFCVMVWYLNNLKPSLTLCLLFVFIPVLISHIFRSSLFAKLEDKAAPMRRSYNAFYNSCCGKDFYKETRMLGAFPFLQKKLRHSIFLLNKAILDTRKKGALVDLFFNTISLLGYGGVLLLAVKYLIAGEISVGAFAAVFSSIDMLFAVMEYFVGNHLGSIADNFGEIRNFLGFLEIETRDRTESVINKKEDIVVQDVSFCYPNASVDALKNINLTIKSGQTVAIVGENGSGKSTLVKLLIGLYTPSSGSVKIGNAELRNISYDSLFKRTSGVFQQYQRYAMTLQDNIEIAEIESADNKKIEEVLVATRINKDDLDVFPDGIDTMLSREFDGVDLSGGQWQRIAIARGLYRESDVVVLDEPTASIDPLEENKIYREFAKIAEGKTAIIVTHRMGSAKIADHIVVMKDGKIVEEGCHRELLLRNGVYADMYNAQAKWY